jgi:hypothetical protein
MPLVIAIVKLGWLAGISCRNRKNEPSKGNK